MICWILRFKTLDPISILWKRLAFWFCFVLTKSDYVQAARLSGWVKACSQQRRAGSSRERAQHTHVPHSPVRLETRGLRLSLSALTFLSIIILYRFSHRNFKEIQQRKSNPKNCITSKARGLLQDVTQMAFISQVDILFCKIALLKNMLSGRGPAVLKLRFP